MRPEKVIRNYRDALKKLNARPCGCAAAGVAHAVACQVGGAMIASAIKTLSWVLGDDDAIGEKVASIIHDANKT